MMKHSKTLIIAAVVLVLAIAAFSFVAQTSKDDAMMKTEDSMMVANAANSKDTMETDTMMVKDEDAMMKTEDTMMAKDDAMVADTMMVKEEDAMMDIMMIDAPVLAGTTSMYYEFTNEAYTQALHENKKILLFFYAEWCPGCIAEQPEVHAAFEELNNPNVVGFRVNYKDTHTDSYETALAKEFGIAYQHTKIILENGKQVLKAPDQWTKERYVAELQ